MSRRQSANRLLFFHVVVGAPHNPNEEDGHEDFDHNQQDSDAEEERDYARD